MSAASSAASSAAPSALQVQLSVAQYRIAVIGSVYLVAAISMPLYNKALFSGWAHWSVAPFKHPLTATAVQLWGVVIVLVLAGATSDLLLRPRARVSVERRVRWTTVLLHVLLPSLAFSGVIALSNVGVQAVSVALHVLLKCGELVAIVGAGAAIEREIPTLLGSVCSIIAALGIALLSIDAHQELDVSVSAILVHVGAVLCGGLHVALMRRAWRKLTDAAAPNAPDRVALLDADVRASQLAVRHEAPLLRRVATAKLALAATTVTIVAAAYEPAAWAELFDVSRTTTGTGLLMAAGVVLTIVFQLSNVAMPRYASSLSVAFVEQVKVFPQLLLALALGTGSIDVSPATVMGGVLVLAGTVGYATERRVQSRVLGTKK
jgi:hypothetical protein